MWAAEKAAPYVHSRLSSVNSTISGDDDKPVNVSIGWRKRNVIEGLLGRIMPMMSKVGLLVDNSSPTNMEQVYNILNSDERLSKNAVAAIMGNIDVETGGSFDFMQQQNKGPGYGLFSLKVYKDKSTISL